MKISAISSINYGLNNTKSLSPLKSINVSFTSMNLPEKGWTKVSGIRNYDALRDVWGIPPILMVGLLKRGDLNVYSENKKPIIAYSKLSNNETHCFFGNGSYYPYMWVVFRNDGQSINEALNDNDLYTSVTENDELVDGVKLSQFRNCTICQKSTFYSSDWDGKDICIPSRYLEILKNHIQNED